MRSAATTAGPEAMRTGVRVTADAVAGRSAARSPAGAAGRSARGAAAGQVGRSVPVGRVLAAGRSVPVGRVLAAGRSVPVGRVAGVAVAAGLVLADHSAVAVSGKSCSASGHRAPSAAACATWCSMP